MIVARIFGVLRNEHLLAVGVRRGAIYPSDEGVSSQWSCPMSAMPSYIPLAQIGTAIRLCALSNIQSALSLPLLAARHVEANAAEELFAAVCEHLRGSMQTFESMRRPSASVRGIKEALQHDTVEFSVQELQRVLNEIEASYRDAGVCLSLRQMPQRLDRDIRRLVSTLPPDSPLLAQDWTAQVESAAAIPSAQLVHYLSFASRGVIVRHAIHSPPRAQTGIR